MNNPNNWTLTHLYIPRSIRAWCFLMLLPWVLPSKAQTSPGPGTLAVAGISESGGCSDMVDSLRFTFGYCPDASAPTHGLFNTLRLTTNDIGRVFPITQADDPNFAFLAAILTNGTSDWVGYSIGAGPCGFGSSTLEQHLFSSLPPGGNGIDFAGFKIDNIALEIDQMIFTHNESGLWTDIAYSLLLFVNSEPWSRPTISTPPENQMAAVGSTVDFVMSAAGNPPLGYRWFFNGTNSLSGGTNSLLELVHVQPDQAGAYTVVITNRFGSVTSSPAILTVIPRPPTILAPPQSQTAGMGSTVDFVVRADAAPPPAYQWLFNGTNSLSGGTNSLLELANVQPDQAGAYTVVVSNAFGAVTSPPAILTVLDPVIVAQPASQLVIFGETAMFSVVSAGNSPLSYQCFKDGARLNEGGNISGAQTATLRLATVLGGDAGGYCVVISNPHGSVTSAVVFLKLFRASYSVLHSFTGQDGGYSLSGLVMSGATLYGTTCEGGSFGQGTVFKVNTDGSGYALLKQYLHDDGVGPCGDLLLSGTTLYGTTYMGGSFNAGTLFKMSTDGSGYVILKQFDYVDGGAPYAGPALFDTTLYGATASSPVLFRVNTNGSGYTVLRRLTSKDGFGPSGSGRLVLFGTMMYGTTQGCQGCSADQPFGTVFKANTDGSGYTVLKSFGGSDGSWPNGGLVLSGTTLYGTTLEGGVANSGTVFKVNTDGSGYAVLHTFTNSPDGATPCAGLVLSDGALYGTTDQGGTGGKGTVFQLNTDGSMFAVLKSFTGSDGSRPRAPLVLSSETLYGTTAYGGDSNEGVVFSLSSLSSIQTSPQTQTAEAGSAVDLWVKASGSSPLFCVWYLNDTNLLSCSTNRELALASVQFSQSGAYTVVVSNTLGSITSAPAMLNVIAPVERRPVPGVKVTGETASLLNVDYADSLSPAPNWATLGSVSLTGTSQYYFDLTLPLPPQRFYRAWQTGTPGVTPSLDLHMVPAITLTGSIGRSVRVDYINQFGPIDAWVTLDTVTLTNTSPLYFDISALGQPQRLYRIVPLP